MDRFRMLPNYQYHDDGTGILETQYKKEMRDYQIFGNSFQDGTPSPDNPIEIQSVGEKTKNLYIQSNNPNVVNVAWENYGNGYKFTSKLNTGGYGNYIKINILNSSALKWGQTYTLSCYVEQSNPNMSSLLRPAYTSNVTNGVKPFINQVANNNTINVITFTLPETQPEDFGNINGGYGSDGIILFINVQRAALDTYESIAITDIMLVEGAYTEDTMPEYEPANKYKIPIKVSEKNLFDINSIVGLRNSSGNNEDAYFSINDNVLVNNLGAYSAYTYFVSNVTYLKAGTYTLSFSVYNDIFLDCYYGIKLTDSYLRKISYITKNKWNELSYTFTLKEDTTILGIYLCMGGNSSNYTKVNAQFKNIQLELSSEATEYEPYQEPQTYNIFLDEPLRKIGNYADYIDFKNGKVVRTVGEYTFSGNEYVDIPSSVINGYTPFRYQGLWSKFKIPLMCNYFSYNQSNYGDVSGQEVLAIYNREPQLFFIVSNSRIPLNDVSAFKKWLSDLYAAGNPIKVMGGLANPTETAIELPKIQLNKGTNIIKVKTVTEPYKVNWQYYK